VPVVERILVPLDLNRLSEAKLPYAEAQARAFNAEIILLHVLPPERPNDETISPHEAQARTYLEVMTARLRSEGIAAQPLLRSGQPADVIVQEIEAQRADLLILGSNVRRGLTRLLLGSIAEAIIARATCPILLIRPEVTASTTSPVVRSFTEDTESAGPVSPRSLGIRTVPVSRIIGSVGRANELVANFRSVSHRRAEEDRYDRVRKATVDGVSLPPIVLYKLGYGYYVLDGNHRVAAAKELGQLEMDALVTEFVPLSDAQGQRVFSERRAFEQSTGLTRIGASGPGQYHHIEEMIRAYAAERGIDDLREAARRWEGEVYRPASGRIHAQRLTTQFAGERTADVFVRVSNYRDEQTRLTGERLTWDEAITRCAEQVAARASLEPPLDESAAE
jgi:nucleotide-binding universal stress UspA family protein